MEQHINSWGNSLGVRIPKAFSESLGVENGSMIDMSLVDGAIVIRPLAVPRRPRYTVEELLAQVPKGYNRSADEEVQEWLNIPRVGKEVIDDDWS